MKPKKPPLTEREIDFLDMAAIHLMAAQNTERAVAADDLKRHCALCWDSAEALLAERKKRL